MCLPSAGFWVWIYLTGLLVSMNSANNQQIVEGRIPLTEELRYTRTTQSPIGTRRTMKPYNSLS